MSRWTWIWYVGCAVWVIDGMLSLRYHSMQHAELAFMVAMVFFVAALFYRAQSRDKR